jgi:hypothetical protein
LPHNYRIVDDGEHWLVQRPNTRKGGWTTLFRFYDRQIMLNLVHNHWQGTKLSYEQLAQIRALPGRHPGFVA